MFWTTYISFFNWNRGALNTPCCARKCSAFLLQTRLCWLGITWDTANKPETHPPKREKTQLQGPLHTVRREHVVQTREPCTVLWSNVPMVFLPHRHAPPRGHSSTSFRLYIFPFSFYTHLSCVRNRSLIHSLTHSLAHYSLYSVYEIVNYIGNDQTRFRTLHWKHIVASVDAPVICVTEAGAPSIM